MRSGIKRSPKWYGTENIRFLLSLPNPSQAVLLAKGRKRTRNSGRVKSEFGRRDPDESSGEVGLRILGPEDDDLDLGCLRRCGIGPSPRSLEQSSGGSNQFGVSTGSCSRKNKSGSWSGSDKNMLSSQVTLMLKGWPQV